MSKSPEVMRARETDDFPKCDGCGRQMPGHAPVLFVDSYGGGVICITCIRWALPQMESMEASP